MEATDGGPVLGVQGNAHGIDGGEQGVLQSLDPGSSEVVRSLRVRGVHPGHDLHDRALPPRPGIRWHRHPVQSRQELDPGRSSFHERLEEKMVEEVVPTDVHDEGDLGADLGDVGEVLIRADTHVRAAAEPSVLEGVEDVQISRLVRDEVVRVEVPARLRDPMDESGEGLGGKRLLRLEGRCPRSGIVARREQDDEEHPRDQGARLVRPDGCHLSPGRWGILDLTRTTANHAAGSRGRKVTVRGRRRLRAGRRSPTLVPSVHLQGIPS